MKAKEKMKCKKCGVTLDGIIKKRKSFTEHVKRDQEKQGLYVFRVPKDIVPLLREPIDLICINKHGKVTFIRARGDGHGHLNRMTIMKLQQLGEKCGARILHASVNGENEIVFRIIYER